MRAVRRRPGPHDGGQGPVTNAGGATEGVEATSTGRVGEENVEGSGDGGGTSVTNAGGATDNTGKETAANKKFHWNRTGVEAEGNEVTPMRTLVHRVHQGARNDGVEPPLAA